jgi:hypothetical protein
MKPSRTKNASPNSPAEDSLSQPPLPSLLCKGECQAESVCALSGKDDTELVALAIARPQEGRYFLALYCRHRGLVESLLNSEKTSVETVSLEATLWSRVYDDLRKFDIRRDRFVSWLVTHVAETLTKIPDELPLLLRSEEVPVPLVPFLHRALDELPQPQRLLLILRDVMNFSISQMLGILDQEGYTLTEEELVAHLQRGTHQVLGTLPQDIYSIYFGEESDLPSEPETS